MSLHWTELTDEQTHLISLLLLFSFVFHLFPLKLMLLQCDSHMYYVGHKTNSAYAVFYIIQFYYRSRGNLFFLRTSMDFFNLTFSVHFMCDKWRKDMHKMENNENKLQEKKKENKMTTMADQYIQIFVVWLLLSCSGLY